MVASTRGGTGAGFFFATGLGASRGGSGGDAGSGATAATGAGAGAGAAVSTGADGWRCTIRYDTPAAASAPARNPRMSFWFTPTPLY